MEVIAMEEERNVGSDVGFDDGADELIGGCVDIGSDVGFDDAFGGCVSFGLLNSSGIGLLLGSSFLVSGTVIPVVNATNRIRQKQTETKYHFRRLLLASSLSFRIKVGAECASTSA